MPSKGSYNHLAILLLVLFVSIAGISSGKKTPPSGSQGKVDDYLGKEYKLIKNDGLDECMDKMGQRRTLMKEFYKSEYPIIKLTKVMDSTYWLFSSSTKNPNPLPFSFELDTDATESEFYGYDVKSRVKFEGNKMITTQQKVLPDKTINIVRTITFTPEKAEVDYEVDGTTKCKRIFKLDKL